MTGISELSKKHLVDYLPAIYRQSELPPESGPGFLDQFLSAFESLLLDMPANGSGKETESRDSAPDYEQPLERKIANLDLLFDPDQTPEEFLPWLAGWAALSFRRELNTTRRRSLLARIIPLYRIRGTRKYLEEILRLCLDATSSVSDAEIPPLQVGTHSTVGADTYIDGGPPYFFRVTLVAAKLRTEEMEAQRELAVTIIELAKPAHTYYDLQVVSPYMQLGTHSTIGVDTMLGPTPT